MTLLVFSVERVQLAYAILGAMFMPLLALTNTQRRFVGERFRSGWWINALLVVTLVLFAYMGILQLVGRMPSFGG